MNLLILILIGFLVLAVALWVVQELAPPDLQRILRTVVLIVFLIWLIRLAYPLLVTS